MTRTCRPWVLLLLGALLFAPGPTTTSRAVDQINGMSSQPVPTTPSRAVVQPDMLWVPDRYLRVPGEPGLALVPGHWEQAIAPHQVYAPPVVITRPGNRIETVPAGVRPPADERLGP